MKTLHQRGLALISLIIVVACILIVGGILAVWLAHLAKKLLGPPPSSGTNTVQQITITVPPLSFPPLAAPPGQTLDRPMGNAYLVIERSTNLIDWEPIMTNTTGEFPSLDPDIAVPMEFFRGNFVYPQ